MKRILLAFIIAFALKGSAQTYVAIPDANFVTYLQSIIPAAMSGNQMNTSSTLVTTTTNSIIVSGKSISNLSGVQYFSSLTYLSCNTNSLTTLPVLPNALTYLDCGSNSLTSLPILPNTLNYIDCSGNSLTSLPVLPNSLTQLKCYFNQLTSLPALPSSLGNLFCGGNSLTSLPPLPNSLQTLNCLMNSLTSLPALPNTLQSLICSNNSLTSLPALPNSLVTALGCSNNFLTSLPTLPNMLYELVCNNNNISCFPTFPNSIATINIDPNPYNCLPNYITAMSSVDLAVPLCTTGNSNGCEVAGISHISGLNSNISVYPNPTSSVLNVECLMLNEKSTLAITDMMGNVVKQMPFNTQHSTINISDLSEGIYNVSISNIAGVVNKRVVIVR